MKLKKILALGIAATLLLTGCGGEKGTQGGVNSGNGKYAVSKKPLELSIHMHYFGNVIFDDNWDVFKKAKEYTNVSLKGTASKSATDSGQVFNIMMASGELPDIVHSQKDMFVKYGMEGAFVPLNNMLEKDAPNFNKFLNENPEARKHLTAPDGNIYFISFVGDGKAAMGYHIRKDWLDKLGLKEPKNVDEFYKTMTAFKNNDPNGNGISDEVPIFVRTPASALQLVNLFGAEIGWYVEDGKVKYGQCSPEFKTGIANLVKWYGEGLIDKEFFTRGNKSREEFLSNNTGGMTRDWFASTTTFNSKLADKIPGFNFSPIAPPADINGKVWEGTSRTILSTNGWGISVSNKHPEETLKYLDFWFTEEGRRLMNYGIEGVHYTMVDGKATFTPEVLKGDKPLLQILNQAGAQLEVGYRQDFDYEKQTLTPDANAAMEMYDKEGYLKEQFPSLAFLPEEQKIISDKFPAVSTYIDETIQKWILQGGNPEAEFDKYLEKVNSLGMQEVISVYQKAYDRYTSEK